MDVLPVVDWIIIGVIAVSTLISLMRGFVKEALSLATMVAAVVIAWMFGSQAATLLVDYISVPSVRLMTAYGVLFVVMMIVGGMVNYLISKFVEMSGLSGTDRLLGMIFGLARGGLIMMVVVAVLSRMPVTEDDWWKGSKLIPHFLKAAETVQSLLFERLKGDADKAQTT